VLVTIDTLRADRLGCYGEKRPITPRIDRLAAAGMLFERASTSLPRTTQSVASILTGRFPKGHRARGLFSSLPDANVTLAEALKEAGYATAAVTSNSFLRPGQGFEQGFDLYDNPPERWDGDSAVAVTARALGWLENRPADRPFFLWVHYLDPHWTYAPAAPFDAAFDPEFGGPFTLYDDLAAGLLTKGDVIFRNRLDAAGVRHVTALYEGEIAQVDAALGPLLDALGRLDPPPLVVLTSDHGESLGEQRYYFAHGEYLYESTLRIPLIAAWSGRIPAGSRSTALVQNIDIAPTIAALVGVSRLRDVDGRPALLPDRRQDRDAVSGFLPGPGHDLVFAESDFQLIHPENPRYYIPGPAGRWSAVSDGCHKLIRIPRPAGPQYEAYDLLDDPGETRDLGEAGLDAAVRARLQRALYGFTDSDPGAGGPREPALSPEERQRLRSLGYVN
jgi:arylsulfatase A-like enzyme